MSPFHSLTEPELSLVLWFLLGTRHEIPSTHRIIYVQRTPGMHFPPRHMRLPVASLPHRFTYRPRGSAVTHTLAMLNRVCAAHLSNASIIAFLSTAQYIRSCLWPLYQRRVLSRTYTLRGIVRGPNPFSRFQVRHLRFVGGGVHSHLLPQKHRARRNADIQLMAYETAFPDRNLFVQITDV